MSARLAETLICSWSLAAQFARADEATVSNVTVTEGLLVDEWRLDVNASAIFHELGDVELGVRCGEP